MVPPASHRVSRVRRYSGYCSLNLVFVYGALTLYGSFSQTILLTSLNTKCSPQPRKNASVFPVWPLPISLAATLGISVDFSSSAYLDVSVQRVYLYIPMYSVYSHRILLRRGFPIRTSADQWLFAPSRSFSQLTTSFIGS